jgi:chromosome segregation ATPase
VNKLKHTYSKCNQYAERDIEQLDNYYMVHIDAMTVESLRSKSDIAAELAFRDECIAELKKEHERVKKYNSSLLAKLKYYISEEEAEIRDLEQKAEGIEAAANDYSDNLDATTVYLADLDCRVIDLRNQAKVLREQGK